MVELSSSGIVLIIYAASYALIVLAVGIMVYRKRKNKDITYCEELVHQRQIYGAIIVHIYDRSTDVAVMVNWGRLTVQELNGNNIEGINMLSFLIPGIFVMILYRFITVCFALYAVDESMEDTKMYHDKEAGAKPRTCGSILLIDYKSTKYEIPLKNKNKKINKSVNTSSPLQKYMPRITHSITSVSNKMANAFLTPPAYKPKSVSNVTDIKPKSLPKNLDDLILPPNFFADDNINEKSKPCKQLKDGIESIETNKIIGRGRSQSLDALRIENDMNKYFRLYYINNKKEFEVGLHLLQENINNLCIKCGVKSSKLKYLQFIDNLNILIDHLKFILFML